MEIVANVDIKKQIDWNSFFGLVSSKDAIFSYEKVEDILVSYFFDTKNDLRSFVAAKEEMKVWLIDTISKMTVETTTSTRKFIDALERDLSGERESSKLFTKQLLLLACQKAPQEVGTFFASHTSLLKEFFSLKIQASDESVINTRLQRIKNWFSFGFDKNTKGALALEQYLFMYRDELWEYLQWSGKREYTPVVAIQKKYLLMELDVLHTLELLAKENPKTRPNFFDSNFFKESLVTGEFLQLDHSYFANELELFLSSTLHSTSSTSRDKIIDILSSMLSSMSFLDLSKKLLPLLHDHDILYFIYHLSTPISSSPQFANQVLLCECKWSNFNYVLIYNSLANHGKQIYSLLKEGKEKEKLDILQQLLLSVPSNALVHQLLSSATSLLEKIRISTLTSFSILFTLLSNFSNISKLKHLIKISRFPFSELSSSFKKSKRKRKREEKSSLEHETLSTIDHKEFGSWKFEENKANVENLSNSITIYSTSDVLVYICSLLYNSLVHSIYRA